MVATLTAPFVDLRAFAANAAPSSSSDWDASRVPAPVPDGDMRLCALVLDDGVGVATATSSEIVMVLDGQLQIAQNAVTLSLQPGDSAVLPKGESFAWHALGQVRALIVSCDANGPASSGVLRIDPSAEHLPSAQPNPDLLVGDKDPKCRQHVDFRSEDTKFYCGTWSSTPYHRLPVEFAHWEVMQLLEGEVAFGDADGAETHVGPGDIIVISPGSVASWRGIGPTRKMFVIYRP